MGMGMGMGIRTCISRWLCAQTDCLLASSHYGPRGPQHILSALPATSAAQTGDQLLLLVVRVRRMKQTLRERSMQLAAVAARRSALFLCSSPHMQFTATTSPHSQSSVFDDASGLGGAPHAARRICSLPHLDALLPRPPHVSLLLLLPARPAEPLRHLPHVVLPVPARSVRATSTAARRPSARGAEVIAFVVLLVDRLLRACFTDLACGVLTFQQQMHKQKEKH